MATSLGGPDEHGEVRPSAALLPLTRATDRQRDHYDSLAGRHPLRRHPEEDRRSRPLARGQLNYCA